jgi:arsenate reductase-like glutaredoxin family protein
MSFLGNNSKQIKSKKIKVKGDVANAQVNEEALVISREEKSVLTLTQQKSRASLWKRKILRRPITIRQKNVVCGWPPQNDKLNIWPVP